MFKILFVLVFMLMNTTSTLLAQLVETPKDWRSQLPRSVAWNPQAGRDADASISVRQTQIVERLDRILEGFFTPERPGLAALVMKNGETVFEKAYGKASLELDVDMHRGSVCRIGSVTKTFTAAAILKMAEEDRVALTDPIAKYIDRLPEYGNSVTIGHLLSHTSGIRNYNNDLSEFLRFTVRMEFTKDELVDLFKDQPLDFAPGTQYRYSNSGYYLLGLVIEAVSGKSYEQFLREEFFEPLSMQDTAVSGPHQIVANRAVGYDTEGDQFRNCSYESNSFCFSDGGVLSSARDLGLWCHALMEERVLSKESLDRLMRRRRLSDGSYGRVGFGWFPGNLMGSEFITHDGLCSGGTCAVICFPKEKLFVAVISNCSWQPHRPPHINFPLRAASILLGKEYETELPLESADSYVGVYRSDTGLEKSIVLEGGRLLLQGRRRRSVYHCSGQCFFVEGAYETLEFSTNGSGKVVSLTSTSAPLVSFRKVRS